MWIIIWLTSQDNMQNMGQAICLFFWYISILISSTLVIWTFLSLPPFSSIFLFHYIAQEIPWTEEPGGLQSMGLQKSQIWLSTDYTPTNSIPLKWIIENKD